MKINKAGIADFFKQTEKNYSNEIRIDREKILIRTDNKEIIRRDSFSKIFIYARSSNPISTISSPV